jgi:protein phosphatase
MNMFYETAQKIILGNRCEQQDSLFVYHECNKVFSAVCDGMGGHSNGHAASITVAETMNNLYLSKSTKEHYSDFFMRAIDILDEKVLSLNNFEHRELSAGTTIATIAIEEDNLFWLSVGDSRIYIIRDGDIVRITRDHNYFLTLNRMLEDGIIDKIRYNAESAKGEQLISYIGMGGIKIFDINDVAFKLIPNDIILLCTDGLYKTITDIGILDAVRNLSPDEIMSILIDESKQSFEDNTTCVVIKYKGGVIL